MITDNDEQLQDTSDDDDCNCGGWYRPKYSNEMTKEDKIAKFVMDAIYKQLDIAGYSHDLIKEENWFSNYTMTEAQLNEWKQWFLSECKSRFRWGKAMGEKEFMWFNLQYGLKIEETVDEK